MAERTSRVAKQYSRSLKKRAFTDERIRDVTKARRNGSMA
jgi:hypothetical protein